MPFQRRGGSSAKRNGGRKGKWTRLTGMFKGKSGGFFGTARVEEVERLIEDVLKKGGREKGIAFGFFKNDDAKQGMPLYSLACLVAEEQGASSGSRSRRIENDPEDDPQGDEQGDL